MKLNTMVGLGLLLASTVVYADERTVNFLQICNDHTYPYNTKATAFLPNPDATPSGHCMNVSSNVVQAPTNSGTLISYENELPARVTALETRLARLRTHLGLPEKRINE